MNHRKVFEALERFEKGVKLLAYGAWRALPCIEDAVRGQDKHGDGGRERALAMLYRFAPLFRELYNGFDDITESLGAGRPFAELLQRATGETPGDGSAASGQEPDAEAAPWSPSPEDAFAEWECPPWLRELEATPRQAAPSGVSKPGKTDTKPVRINWRRHQKCHEPYVADRILEVCMRLRGEPERSTFRLEAVRPAGGGDYEVAIYRQKNVMEAPDPELGESAGVPKEFLAWVRYDLIWTRHASADRALDQVLGFLACRCE